MKYAIKVAQVYLGDAFGLPSWGELSKARLFDTREDAESHMGKFPDISGEVTEVVTS